MESADRMTGWSTIVAGLATMVVGVVMETSWVAVGTAGAAVLFFGAEWLYLRRTGEPASVADEPDPPRWPESEPVARAALAWIALTAAKAAAFVGLALLIGVVFDHAAFVEIAGGTIATGAMQVRGSRRERRASPARIAGL